MRVFSQVKDMSCEAELLTIFPCLFAAPDMSRVARPRTTWNWEWGVERCLYGLSPVFGVRRGVSCGASVVLTVLEAFAKMRAKPYADAAKARTHAHRD